MYFGAKLSDVTIYKSNSQFNTIWERGQPSRTINKMSLIYVFNGAFFTRSDILAGPLAWDLNRPRPSSASAVFDFTTCGPRGSKSKQWVWPSGRIPDRCHNAKPSEPLQSVIWPQPTDQQQWQTTIQNSKSLRVSLILIFKFTSLNYLLHNCQKSPRNSAADHCGLQ